MDSLLSRVESTLQKHRMLSKNDQVLVACSGGADSTALFHLLRELGPEWNLRLHLLHFDHGLRKTSRRDLEFVKKLARRFRVPFHGGGGRYPGDRLPAPKRPNSLPPVCPRKDRSPEEHAREMRYAFFEKAARKTGIRKIALAHHLNDQAETVLMRILQGTGLRGLQGIRPVMRGKGIAYIRPLMELNRSEIRSFLKENRITFREDRTNRSKKFLRNRVRHILLPLLEKEFNPRVGEALSRLAGNARAELAGFDEWVRKNWKNYLLTRRNGTSWFDRERFLALPSPLQFRLLNRFLQAMDERSGLDHESWKKIEAGLRLGRFRMTLPGNLDLRLTAKKLFVRKNATMASAAKPVCKARLT